MSPSGGGFIYITLPEWYTVGTTSYEMYNPNAINLCSSTCFTLFSSIYDAKSNNIVIKYLQMSTTCQRSQITVKCKGFYNPISPKI